MEHQVQGSRGTYRCPVCGHRDAASVPPGRRHARIVCTYCETHLEVGSRGPYSVRFSVRVAEEAATR